MSYSKKSKCQGCAALSTIKKHGKILSFNCEMGLKITTMDMDGNETQPTPTQKCWKPKTVAEVRQLKKAMA